LQNKKDNQYIDNDKDDATEPKIQAINNSEEEFSGRDNVR
jgi:hypothetical protein